MPMGGGCFAGNFTRSVHCVKAWKRCTRWTWLKVAVVLTMVCLALHLFDDIKCLLRLDPPETTVTNDFLTDRYLDNVDDVLGTLYPYLRSRRDDHATTTDNFIERVQNDETLTDVQRRKPRKWSSDMLGYKRLIPKGTENEVYAPGRTEKKAYSTQSFKKRTNYQMKNQPAVKSNKITTKSRQGHALLSASSSKETKYNSDSEEMKTLHPTFHSVHGSHQSQEHPALADFRLGAQRIASICPATVKNRTSSLLSASNKNAEGVKGVFWHPQTRTAYCSVPKAGCTFWIRVFAFLQNHTSQSVRSPWDLTRFAVHLQNLQASGTPLWMNKDEIMAPDTLRFLVVRDPYARLWSAYLDKLILPDFWATVGVDIVRRLRKSPTERARRCGNDVTFSEFVQEAIRIHNAHWDPIHTRCDPCTYRPQVVARLDTFARDSAVLLRRMGLGHVLDDLNRTSQKVHELRSLVEYNFYIFNTTSRLRQCLTPAGLARLLWRAFQLNGYLPAQELYVTDEAGAFSVQGFTAKVIRVFRESAVRLEAQLKQQKRHFMRDAYRSLSPELLDRLQIKYQLDFQLFGYDVSPFTD